MDSDDLSFLEDERDTFRPLDALDALSDEQLDMSLEIAGGWQWNAGPEVGPDGRRGARALRALPRDEVRAMFKSTLGELRGYLTVVSESRWIKHAALEEHFCGETNLLQPMRDATHERGLCHVS